MSWDAGQADTGGGGSWGGGAEASGFDSTPTNGGYDGFAAGGEGAGDYAGANDGGGGGDDRACFNCGQPGHMKSECTNDAVPREFTGTCRLCEGQGHRASDCPTAPPKICRNCCQPGHESIACEAARLIDRSHIEALDGDAAWNAMRAAADDREMEDLRAATESYFKANPEVTWVELEQSFRELNINCYLIGLEKELESTYTNMDLQGNLGKKFSINFRWSPNPARPKEKDGWPESAEDNLERLADAGIPVDCGKPKCSNCSEIGHISKNCDQEKNENADRAQVQCYNCNEIGHRVRDCPIPRPDRNACRNCKQSGHSSKECLESRSAEGVECKKCNEIGHFSKDCPTAPQIPCFNCNQLGHRKADCTNERVMICRNCDAEGHASRECDKPRDYSRVECSNCKQKGHTKVRCKEPLVEDNDGNGGGGYGAGAAGYGDAGGGDAGGGDDFGVAEPVANGGGNSWGGGGGHAETSNGGW